MSILTAQPRGRVVLVIGTNAVLVIPRDLLTSISLGAEHWLRLEGEPSVNVIWSICNQTTSYGLIVRSTAEAIVSSVLREDVDVIWTLVGEHWTRVPDLPAVSAP